MAKKKDAGKKEIVFKIEYRIYPEDAGAISEIIDKMRELGSAEILDVYVEPEK